MFARWGFLGRIASTDAMSSRIAQVGDDARRTAFASAMRLLTGSHVRCALRHCTGPSAKHSVHGARAARMDIVRPMGHARVSPASLATCATSAQRAYSEMIVPRRAAWTTPATGTEHATLQAHACAMRGSRDRIARYALQAEDGAWSVSKSADGT